MHWAVPYIGREWISGAQGPYAFDCWGLVRYIQRERFGLDLPVVDVDARDLMDVIKSFRDSHIRAQWRAIQSPVEGDCVLLSQATHPCHVGIWVDIDGGGVLHCVRNSGVIFNSLTALHLNGWRRIEFYRYASCCRLLQ